MSIRLVSDDNSIFWFTSFHWRWLVEFVGRHGWKGRRVKLLPDHWEDIRFNKQYEQVGGAQLSAGEAKEFADAITRGIATPAAREFLLSRISEGIKEPERYAERMLADWSEFARFARKGGFRVDAND